MLCSSVLIISTYILRNYVFFAVSVWRLWILQYPWASTTVAMEASYKLWQIQNMLQNTTP